MNTLREAMRDYLAMRRDLGYKLHDAGVALSNFVSFMERRRTSRITMRLAVRWAQMPKSVQPTEWARRLGVVRGFARYRSAFDPRTEIPPLSLLPYRHHRPAPYLYTDEEIKLLLAAALNIRPAAGIRRWTYFTLLGLLSVTGMRVGEAQNLELKDVDLEECVITVRGAKFGKNRLIPIHPSTRDELSNYLRRRSRFLAGRQARHFFVSTRAKRLNRCAMYNTFNALSRQTGLRDPLARHGPRLHDFRHRLAVSTLQNWYRSGEDSERNLPILSTYLGHTRASDTYWYLNQHPELMGLAVARLENRWKRPS